MRLIPDVRGHHGDHVEPCVGNLAMRFRAVGTSPHAASAWIWLPLHSFNVMMLRYEPVGPLTNTRSAAADEWMRGSCPQQLIHFQLNVFTPRELVSYKRCLVIQPPFYKLRKVPANAAVRELYGDCIAPVHL